VWWGSFSVERTKTFFSSSRALLSRSLHKDCSWLLGLEVLGSRGGKVQEIPHQGADAWYSL